MMYTCIMKYSNLLLSNKCKKLLIANPRGPQTIVDKTRVYEEALNNFTL